MFQVNDLIMYGNHGVCKVTDIGSINMSMIDKNKQFYTLRPVYHNETVVYAPVDNEKSVMRLIISKEEAQKLIEDIPEIESVWIGNDKEREAQYKATLRTCDCKELIKIIKTLYKRKQSRIQSGKKVTAVDERYFRMAEEQLYGELAIALDMEKDKVGPYITECISKKETEIC